MTTNQTPAKKAGGAKVAPKKPLNPGKKLKKPKKPMPKFMVAVWSFLVFLLLLAGAGYCIYANIGGIAEKALVMLPQYKASLESLDKQQKDLQTREAKLKVDQDNLAATAKANDKAAADLKAREDKLVADRQALENTAKSNETAEEKKKAVVEIYAGMDAATVAAMLLKAPSLAEAADILKLLPQENIVEILAAIEKEDAKKAYDLTKLMMK